MTLFCDESLVDCNASERWHELHERFPESSEGHATSTGGDRLVEGGSVPEVEFDVVDKRRRF